MTIAACYVCAEGVVLGADSTTTISSAPGTYRFFNNNQKIFEIGASSSIGVATWGLAAFGVSRSIRTVIAEFGDWLKQNPQSAIADVASEWSTFVWTEYNNYISSAPELATFRLVSAKPSFDPTDPSKTGSRSQHEEQAYLQMCQTLSMGFYVGGRCDVGRNPGAFRIEFAPTMSTAPTTQLVDSGVLSWAGVPNMASRVLRGFDPNLRKDLLDSGKWAGSESELDHLLARQNLSPQAILPMRDAIDYVYSCIFGTIKAMKFSQFPPVCGGSIEVAVMTSDRDFRWVKHKSWATGIDEVA